MNKTIINKVEAEKQTGVSQRTIYTWANVGKLTKYFIPKYRSTFMVCLEELQEKVKESKRKS